MSKVKYRPRIKRLLDGLIEEIPGGEFFKLDIPRIAELAGVSRATIYNWLNSDTDNPNDWFTSYDPRTEQRIREIFSRTIGHEVEVMEEIKITDSLERDNINKMGLAHAGKALSFAASAATF
jgi:hypothetical protein